MTSWMNRLGWTIAAGLALASPVAAVAAPLDRQQMPVTVSFVAATSASQSESDDQEEIIVTGTPLPGEKPPVEVVPGRMARMALESRTAYDKAGIFTRCARFLPLSRLRKVIDGPPNRTDTAYTLGLLVANNIGCHLKYSGLGPADLVSFGRSPQRLYDRGALLDQVIGTYAPDLELTRTQTTDPAVHARFNQREVPRNRWREPDDYRYFEITVCMVRLAPELAVRLVKSEPGSSAQRRLQEAIIVQARLCVGNAKRVEVDQTQFRIYITDAVYRWAVAARGVDSLIPSAE